MTKPPFKYKTLLRFFALIVVYVGGMSSFMYLKLLGFTEMEAIPTDRRQSMVPFAVGMGLIIAVGIGILELKVFNKWDRFSFRKYSLYKYLLILFTIIGAGAILFFFVLLAHDVPPGPAIRLIPGFLRSEIFLSMFLYLLLFSFFLNLVKVVTEYLGPQAMWGALVGRYNQPKEEDRTFIFIDLTSSTTLAEKMGHVKYSQFIDQCFQLLTRFIYDYDASLYQFVGDEAVLTWYSQTAKKKLAPVRLYYAFEAALKSQREMFIERFGEVPHFKAAVHAGVVTVTEIRSTKTDIVYHGDVLNTTARIMGQCSPLKKDLLVSDVIAEWMQDHQDFDVLLSDSLQLRGKVDETIIYEVKQSRQKLLKFDQQV
ncbi:MAG: adenylate/guanylate cyclase domain-containing protein [Bacteroidota bacterium]